MPRIQLYEGVGAGLIIAHPSGVIYSNQTGGTACLHPELEGVFVPLRNDFDAKAGRILGPEASLLDYFEGPKHEGSGAHGGLDEEDAVFIGDVLRAWRLDGFIEVDRERLKDSHEAWVFVVIKGDETADHPNSGFVGLTQGFGPYPRTGILTWTNSD